VDFKTTFPDIASAASGCDTTASEVQQKLASLRSYVVGLEESWQGVASTSFQDLMVQYDNNASRLHEALTGIANGLRGTHSNYTDSESANLKAVTNIHENLGPANLS
jgi:WXG100 family type VII secretion target